MTDLDDIKARKPDRERVLMLIGTALGANSQAAKDTASMLFDIDAMLAMVEDAHEREKAAVERIAERDQLRAALERAPMPFGRPSRVGQRYDEWYEETRELLR